MSIAYIIAAFSCGVLACTMGACASFVMAGIVGVAGYGVSAAMNAGALASPELAAIIFPAVAEGSSDVMNAVLNNLGFMIANLSFDAMFAPAIAFVAPLWAGAYAKKRNYISSSDLSNAMCWVPLLEPQRKIDVLLVGGIGGVIGAVGNWFLTVFLGIGIDGHATMIFISCLCCKFWIDGKLVNPRTPEGKLLGSRWNPNQQRGWLGHLNEACMRYTMAIFCGACFGYAVRIAMLSPVTFSIAHTLGFLVGAIGLIFLMMGFSCQPLMPMVVPACFIIKGMVIGLGNTPAAAAAVSEIEFMIWGAGGACVGITACDFLVQLFSIYSDVYIDPPGCAIMCGSFVGFTIVPSFGLSNSIAFPVCCIIFGIAYSLIEYLKCRNTPAYQYKLASNSLNI